MLNLIGNTPLVKIPTSLHNTSNNIFAKLEYFNPTKSLKDRVAIWMINKAEEKGIINKETVLVEPTSGNMGISLAFICSLKGYKIILTMSEAMSIERRKLIKHFGADYVLTKKELGFQGAMDKAYEIKNANQNYVVLNQYDNPDNFDCHFNTTGREILDKLNDIDIFLAGAGTGACVSGVSAFIKSQKSLYTIAIEPEESDILSGGSRFSPHAIQGIGPNFFPKNFKNQYIDEIFKVSKEQAYGTAKIMAQKAGIACGISSAANAFAAFEVAKKVEKKNICFICADFCERYASSDFFD